MGFAVAGMPDSVPEQWCVGFFRRESSLHPQRSGEALPRIGDLSLRQLSLEFASAVVPLFLGSQVLVLFGCSVEQVRRRGSLMNRRRRRRIGFCVGSASVERRCSRSRCDVIDSRAAENPRVRTCVSVLFGEVPLLGSLVGELGRSSI